MKDETTLEEPLGSAGQPRLGQEPHEREGRKRAVVLARSIVADIALYHQDEVHKAARGEASTSLESVLDEGRRILRETVDFHYFPSQDPVGDAFNSLLDEL